MSGSKKVENKDERCGCYAESRTKDSCGAVHNVTHPLRYYEFTQEEMKALEECDRESFYGRCLPFSAVLASLTYAAIKNDISRPHQHFGPVPKMMAAAAVGYVLGRLSYQGHYDERLRELPSDSHLGNVLRKYHTAKNPPPPPPAGEECKKKWTNIPPGNIQNHNLHPFLSLTIHRMRSSYFAHSTPSST